MQRIGHSPTGIISTISLWLAVYQLPYDPLVPVVCMDESCKQLIGEVQESIPGAPGQVARVDHEYVRNGVAEIFLEWTIDRETARGSDGTSSQQRLGLVD